MDSKLKHYWVASAGMELRMTTSTRLKACLYSFTSPGGPMYPTRAVRHAAWDALDSLFPVSLKIAHSISLTLAHRSQVLDSLWIVTIFILCLAGRALPEASH